MFDQVIIGNLGSVDDFDASMAERTIGEPKKKSIKETVPFSNAIYDFTKINGEIYWKERTLEYIFEIIADSPQELEEKKLAFKTWVMNIHEEELHDPYITDYHFIATFDDIKCDDSEIEKSTIEVTFTACPYMISNNAKRYVYPFEANVEKLVLITNKSSHKITPTLTASVPVTIKKGNTTFSISAGATTDDSFEFEMGNNELTLQAGESGTLEISFYEEVF